MNSIYRDICLNPHKYNRLFDNVANLKILNYLEMCNRVDAVPYYSDFELVRFLDRESFKAEEYELSEEQFCTVVQNFQYKAEGKNRTGTVLQAGLQYAGV